MVFLKVIIIIVMSLCAISLLSTFFIYRKLFGSRMACNDNTEETNLEKKVVTFYSGKNKLQGYFYLKNTQVNTNDKIVLIVHGHGVTHRDYMLEIESFVQRNFTVFTYDMTGCGESEGNALNGFAQFILDAKAALDYLSGLKLEKKIILYGHSVGGFAVAALLNYVDEQIDYAVVVSAFNSSSKFVRMTMQKYLKIFAFPLQLWIYLFERLQFGEIALSTGVEGINKFHGHVMIVQDKNDPMVGYKSSLYALNQQITNKHTKYLLIENGNHNPVRTKLEEKNKIDEEVFDNILMGLDM